VEGRLCLTDVFKPICFARFHPCVRYCIFSWYLQYLLVDFRHGFSPNFCHWCILRQRWTG